MSFYDDYINSEAWKKKRQSAFKKHGKNCSCCGSTKSLHVHHKTYKNLGHERLDDLEVKCSVCHTLGHVVSNITKSFSKFFSKF